MMAVESGDYVTCKVWKQLVKRYVHALEQRRFIIRSYLYKSLCFIRMGNHTMCSWWIHAYYDHKFSKCNRIIVRLLLNVNMHAETLCRCCSQNVINNVSHILFVCHCNDDIRRICWNNVRLNTTEVLFSELSNMPIRERTEFILNACNLKYCHEWKNLFDSLSLYIYEVYSSYRKALGNIDY